MRFHMRQVKELKNGVNSAMAENPSEEIAFRISSFLDEWKAHLHKVEDILNEILEATDFSDKTPAQIEEAEAKLTKAYNTSVMEYGVAKGKVTAMHARLSLSLIHI